MGEVHYLKKIVLLKSILILNLHSYGLDLAAFSKADFSSVDPPAAKIYNVNVCPRVRVMLPSVRFNNVHISPADKHVTSKERGAKW